ncbi:TPA: ABC transporter substrate-binding protein [Klebsiella quasipneumoniae]
MKKCTLGVIALSIAGALNTANADTLKMECGNSSAAKSYCDYIKSRFEKETPHKLEFVQLPPASDEKLGLFQQIFAAKDGKAVDVFQADTVWLGGLDKHLLDLTASVKDLQPKFFPSAWNNNVVNGKVKAIPAFLDAGVMFYRKDLLAKYGEKPPETWEELTRIATKIQKGERAEGHKNFWGFVFQGKAYEGMFCDALEWVASYNGGTFIDKNGNITINNPQAAKALNMAASWIGNITPKGVLGYMEEESRAVFQNGDAAFMRNWPYAYVLAQDPTSPIKNNVGIIPVPKGGDHGQHVSTLGGWQWAVSAYTEHPDAAIKLVRILTDAESQKMQFKFSGSAPSRLDVYDDPEVKALAPFLDDFKEVFATAIPRPAVETRSQFPKVSKAVFNAAYDVLSGRSTGEEAVADLETKLKRIKGKAWK